MRATAPRIDGYVAEEWRIPKPPVSSYIGKTVEYLRQDRPAVQKIFTYSIAFLIAALSIVCLVGVVIVPMLYSEYQEQLRIESNIDSRMTQILEKRLKPSSMDLTVGDALYMSLGDIGKYPQLDLKGRTGATNYLDFLEPWELPQSICVGQDSFGRHFISLKLFDKVDQNEFVVTLFERHSGGHSQNNWALGHIHKSPDVFKTSPLTAEDVVKFYNIVQGRTDLKYRLAT